MSEELRAVIDDYVIFQYFFFILFFACGLVNNKFIDLLEYEVCRENLAEVLKNVWGIRE